MKTATFIFLIFSINLASAQDFFDNFESYAVGEQLVVQNPVDWTTWSGTAGNAEDPYIVEQNGNAVNITGTNDLVYVMPNYTSNLYYMLFDLYIPDGSDAYFNTLQEFNGAGSSWGMQVYFGHTNLGQGNIDGGGALIAPFTFDYNTWLEIKVIVDLVNDWGLFFLNDTLIHEWIWSSGTFGTGNLNQLGGNSFFAWDGGVFGSSDFFIDNYSVGDWGSASFMPENVHAMVIDNNNILVSWDPPYKEKQPIEDHKILFPCMNHKEIQTELQGYNVLRNWEFIAYVDVPTQEYLDVDLDPGTYEYCVRAVYDIGTSMPSCADSVTISNPQSPPLPPENLEAIWWIGDSAIQLTWDPPDTLDWIHWDNGINTGNGIGLGNGGTFFTASRWETVDLVLYNGLALKKIRFFPNGDPNALFVLKVWTGPNGNYEVISQEVISYTVDEWNEVELENPHIISAAEHLWFGYSVTAGGGTNPAGCDDGPAIQNKGDLFSIDGSNWESLSLGYGLDYNWNLQAWLEPLDGAFSNELILLQQKSSSTDRLDTEEISNVEQPSNCKSIIGYNIYYSYNDTSLVFLDFTTEEEYFHYPLNIFGLHCYRVTAVYDPEGESGFSNWAYANYTDIPGNVLNTTQIFPNPATDVVNIESNFLIKSVTIYNYSGQLIAAEDVDNTAYQVNISQLQSGVYFFRIITDEGSIAKRIIIE